MSEIEKLMAKRKVLRNKVTKLITKIETYLNECDDLADIDKTNALKEFREQLIHKESELISVNSKVEDLCDISEIENEVSISDEYNEKIVLWKQKILNVVDNLSAKEKGNISVDLSMRESRENTPPLANSQLTAKASQLIKTVKLPKLYINKYYGNPAHWLKFFNQFESAIHNNNSLSKVDKFNYLKSYVGGIAASCINGFALTDENYDIALKLLKNRFGNKNSLIQAHLNQLLKLPFIRNVNDLIGLRKLFDCAESQKRNLESLGIDTETYGNLLSPILIERIPREIVLELNRNYPENNWVFKDLFSFLEKK
ncbi:uncharacterized protein [Parasteatoda tepidariorum]|uniref:uncharacterized protein n=1 Tax=Parasteatoda tepidariorum TaxID=114398 RepID=UPI0039BD7B77